MLYREAGQFKSSYAEDQQIFPIRQDGIAFGLPSLRIKGLYLAVATLACQFFVLWAINRIGWLSNYSTSGVITAQKVEILGYELQSPAAKYVLTLAIVTLMALAAKNL